MKLTRKFIILLLGVISVYSCKNDEVITDINPTSTDMATVNFELDARVITTKRNSALRGYQPSYTKDGFSIYAFRQLVDGNDFLFEKEIPIGNNFSYGNFILKGSENLPIGTYKFIPAYGIKNQSGVNGVLNTSTLTKGQTKLTDNLELIFIGSKALSSEIFLQTGADVSALTPYQLGTTLNSNQKVTATLKRAVGRVDIMFIAADKLGDGTYQEKETDPSINIFGNRAVEGITLNFTGVNNMMNMFGENRTAVASTLSVPLENLSSTIVIGNGTQTIVGDQNYTRFDNVQSEDIIRGAAHIFGTYLFPNNDDSKNVGLNLSIKLAGLPARPIDITLDNNKLPLEQNKVTVVKIYVLNGNDVGTTTTEFEYEIDTVWEDAHEVEGEIS